MQSDSNLTTPPLEGPVIAPEVRRSNVRLLAVLVIFAVVLATACTLWMYGRMVRQREGERAARSLLQTEPATPANPSASPVAPR